MTPSTPGQPTRAVQLEIAIASAAGAAAAQAGGANRVELCSGLELGGLTPSAGLVDACMEAGTLPVNVLLRPRPGDFHYDESELATAEREARMLARQGVAGVVLGALRRDGTIDVPATSRLIAAVLNQSADTVITFHRAIDHVADPIAALETLAGLNVHRVLSSGQAHRAIDGLAVLKQMKSLNTDVEIMAGGGVRPEDIPVLIGRARVDAVHLSAKISGPSVPASAVALGSADQSDPNRYFITDESLVRSAAENLDK